VTGVFDERLEGYKGPMGCVILSQEFYETERARGFVRGYSFEMLRGMGPLSTALWGQGTGQLSFGAGHHEAFDALFDRTAGMVAICEDLPEPENRVTLDPTLVDSNGIPAPKIEYRLGENSERMLAHAVERGKEALVAAGARRTYATAPLRPAGWHLMGTARMGTDPETSVVNPWGRAHDVKNLFVVDGSVFVTSAAVNPTNTIQAFALYVGDRIKKSLSDLFD
jgi:choline dehydrogenase-like flavoprotein